jgi:hypothetical protein
MKEVLKAFDSYLASEGLRFEAVIIGGAALIVMEVVDRQTKDVDCLDPVIDAGIKRASVEFAKKNPKFRLQENWLNNGPSTLKRELPQDWASRIREIYKGNALLLTTLGRIDLLRSKLYAYCDRQTDLDDCVALEPSLAELLECYPWVSERDASPLWPDHVLESWKILAKRRGYEFNP